MSYTIRMGRPQMAEYWNSMKEKETAGTLSKKERELFKKMQKALRFLRENPAHPGLNSHTIDVLTKREGFTIYESYLENHTPSAGRLFWTYGPDKDDITVLGVVPHPSKSGYKRVPLSNKAAATANPEKNKKGSSEKSVKKKK
jgi:hypothetical protein